MSLSLRNLSKQHSTSRILDNVSVEVARGELVALLGPSGSGKTSLLRIIAGLDQADSGQVLFEGKDMTQVSVRDRRVGFVFQNYALFRHMSVFENIAFGLRVKNRRERPARAAIAATVTSLIDRMQLDGLDRRKPDQLSGGQRQRVALARALAVGPSVLLLDEPFGALDATVRKDLRRWLRRLHNELNLATVFVTHDQEEALELADRVVVMNQGRVEQDGKPQDVYDAPANPFVLGFMGAANRLVRGHTQGIMLNNIDGDVPEGVAASIYIRPHDIALTPDDRGTGRIRFLAEIGAMVRLEIDRGPGLTIIEVELSRQVADQLGLKLGQIVAISAERGLMFSDD
jgi:sulfate transport system ATP-binding protein